MSTFWDENEIFLFFANAHITQESPGWWLDTVHAVKQPEFHAVRAVLVIDDADKKRIVVEL